MSNALNLTTQGVTYCSATGVLTGIDASTATFVLTSNGTGVAPSFQAGGGPGASPLTTKGDLYTYSTLNDRLPIGSNSTLLMADSVATTGNKWTTATYPNTTTVSQLLYSSSANTIAGLATANNSALVTDGTGIPSLSATLPSAVQGNITTVGTVTSGTWSATTIGVTKGGTGLAVAAQGDILYGSAADTYSALAKDAGSTRYLSNTGASNNPAWAQVALTTGVSGVLPETNGGTNQSTYATGDILYASGSNVLSKLAISTNPGAQLISTGSIPAWQSAVTDIFLEDDFITNLNSPGNTAYGANAQNGGGVGRIGILGHPGVADITTGTAANGALGLSHGNTIIAGSGRILLNFIAKIVTLSDATDTFTLRIGLGSDANATLDFVDGCYFEYSHGVNSGNWTIKTANNSTRTTANTSTAADTNWHLFTVDVNAGATSVSFYIDGTEVANSPIVTNLPGTTRLFSDTYRVTKSVGTTARNLYLDYTSLWIKCTSNRY